MQKKYLTKMEGGVEVGCHDGAVLILVEGKVPVSVKDAMSAIDIMSYEN